MFDATNQYELSLVINGSPLTEYLHNGNVFVEGRTNSNYELRVRNNSPERIMAILSVDGLGVIDGKVAGADSPGYVIEPWQTLSVPGWKVDGATAAKFQFGSASGSYSNRSGRGKKNVGVIGMMVFRPKYQPPINWNTTYTFAATPNQPWMPTWNSSSPTTTLLGGSLANDVSKSATRSVASNMAAPTGASVNNATLAVSSQNLGTEFGDATNFQTVSTTFEKRDPAYPDALIAIYYDDANGLEARGILLPYRNSAPQAFPTYTSSNTTSNFAPPPPGWTRK